MINILSVLRNTFTKHRRVQRGQITALVCISDRGQFCCTRSYTTPLQLMLFDIPDMR